MSTPQTLSMRFGGSAPYRTTPEEMMARLSKFQPQQLPVISLYLDARVNQHGKHAFAPFVRKRMTEIARTYAPHSRERASFDEDFVRIERYLEDKAQTSTQGIAIFACSAVNDFFDVGEFAAPFEQNQIVVSNRPHLYPLARMTDRYPRYAVVVADTNRAHIFVFACGRRIDKRDVQNIDTKEPRDSGWQESRFQNHVENFQLHHAKQVVEALDRTVREDRIERIILAGDQETIVPLLRAQMTRELADKIVDVMPLEVEAAEQKVLEESLNRIRRYDSLDEMQKIERLLNEYRADDLAVAGVASTLAALSNGQVQELLLTARPADLSYDKSEVANVLQLYSAEPEPPTKLDHETIADELVRRAHKQSAAKVTIIEDATRLNELGGVGAILRYRVSSDRAAPYEDSSAATRAESLVKA